MYVFSEFRESREQYERKQGEGYVYGRLGALGSIGNASITELFIDPFEPTSNCCNFQFPKRPSVISRTPLDSDEPV